MRKFVSIWLTFPLLHTQVLLMQHFEQLPRKISLNVILQAAQLRETKAIAIPAARTVNVSATGLSIEQALSDIIGIVRDLTGSDVDPAAPLLAQGLDSLAAMELRQKIQVCHEC